MKVYIKSEINNDKIKIIAFDDYEIISEYILLYNNKNNSDKNIIEILKNTMISWAIVDLCFADKIIIKDYLDDICSEYISNNYILSKKIYEKIYGKKCGSLEIKKSIKNDCNTTYEYILDPNKYIIGFSGGKDSTLCKFFLEEMNMDYSTYKVDYDSEQFSGFAHYSQIVKNNLKYEKYHSPKIVNFISREADDIHVTFALSLLNNEKIGNLVVGLPWDAVHVFNDGTTDLVPTETAMSIKILEKYIKDKGIKNFKILSPLASLHSFGVYELIYRLFNNYHEYLSCWDGNFLNVNKNCGSCLKCQRTKYILKKGFNEEYVKEIPILGINDPIFKYGSYFANELEKYFSIEDIKTSCFIDEDVEYLDNIFYKYIVNKFGFKKRKIKKELFKFNNALIDSEDISRKIYEKIGYKYDNHEDNFKYHDIELYLPFENGYKKENNYSILSYYNIWDVYDKESKRWGIIKINYELSEQDNHFISPKTEIFEQYLDKEIIIKYLNLNRMNFKFEDKKND
ncbi:hypothetical protein ACF3OF_02390 [Sneathia vaginalis]|uniref:hypothetical protein n=1 Tax=Sneathia vaginalis TaxID=187101 RepID=UPI00370DE1F4